MPGNGRGETENSVGAVMVVGGIALLGGII
jgi:hypothetical protein